MSAAPGTNRLATDHLNHLLVKVALVILLAEAAAWCIAGNASWKVALLHGSLVTLCCSAWLYFWVFRPLELQHVSTLLELQASRDRLDRFSRVDPLTGIANRRTFFEQLEQEWNRASRYGTSVACIMLDLDEFQQVNDQHGHLAGDAALRRVGQLLRSLCRASDVLCRFGGEEFCIVLPETSEKEAADFAERLRREIAKPATEGSVPALLTASLGVAGRHKDMTVAEHLVESARRALAHAQQHRDCVTRASQLDPQPASA